MLKRSEVTQEESGAGGKRVGLAGQLQTLNLGVLLFELLDVKLQLFTVLFIHSSSIFMNTLSHAALLVLRETSPNCFLISHINFCSFINEKMQDYLMKT